MRNANVCRPAPVGQNRRRIPVPVMLLLAGMGSQSATLGCSDERRPGILVEVRVEKPEFRPDVVVFDWIAPGRPVLLRGELSERRRPSDEMFFASMFVETRGPLQASRVLVLSGLRGGQLVSGTFVVIDPTFDSFRSLAILLGPPLSDSDGDSVPDLVDRCSRSDLGNRCVDPPDAGSIMSLDGPVAPDATPIAPEDAGVDVVLPEPDAGVPQPDAPVPSGDAAAARDGRLDAVSPPRDSAAPDLEPPPPAPPDPLSVEGLIGYWRFDEAEGAAALDSSGNENPALLQAGASRTSNGKFGGAVSLAATVGSCLVVPDSQSLDAIRVAFTIAAWTRRPNNLTGTAVVLSRRYFSTDREHYALAFNDGVPFAMINTSNSASNVIGGSAPARTGDWVHVATTYDTRFLRLYVAGKLAAMLAHDLSIVSDSNPLTIGCTYADPAGHSFGGDIDEVLLYSRALDPAEIARLAAGERPLPSS